MASSAATNKDHWSSEAYQHSASFVPKLATKIMQWLDPQADDVILDIGCGDGVLDVEIGRVLARGKGSLHGIDSSPSMIQAAEKAAKDAGLENCTFEVLDATTLINHPALPQGRFTRAFSNAALHWVLRPADRRAALFAGVRDALVPGGVFAFEMGGLGNVSEMRAALLSAVARRVGGIERAREIDPWFFPDEAWARDMLENTVGGWKVEKAEREWRATPADKGGVDGWIRLMGKQFFDALPPEEREACVREVVDVLEVVCAQPGGGQNINYVRLRVLARRV